MEIVNIGKFVQVNPKLAIQPTGHRIFIREDDYEDASACQVCDGSGSSGEECGNCKGEGVEVSGSRCRVCSPDDLYRSPGKRPCLACAGKGVKAGKIIDPHRNDRARPATGTIFAIGSLVENQDLQPGVKVMYSNYAGTEMKIGSGKGDAYRIVQEEEISCIFKGLVTTPGEKPQAQQDFEAIGGSKS